ncbi:diacylglycerol/lipid kinase family protein [Qipengyuania sp. DSG2-2]|uniref:diacylglycerol/lipid kinase family protein n=1 Tax=Qipengyuania sp. DGS2-2 TaxID=3349631 RepID=UPI0036D24DB1
MKMDLVYNPVAGSFRAERLDRLVEAFAAHGFAVQPMATTAAGAVLSGEADLVCVHGGDGTLRDTVQALMQKTGEDAGATPLCLAPAGTINLVARELGYARDPGALARQIAASCARGSEGWVHSPLYALGETPIVSCLSIGPDSHAVAGVSPALKKRIGRYAYGAAMMKQLRRWPRAPMPINGELADGSLFETQAEAAIVSHGALYGGPFRLSRLAALQADSVELITMRQSTRTGTAALMTAAMLGRQVEGMRGIEIRTCRRISFADCVAPVQVDGDHMPECAHTIEPTGISLRYCV